MTSESLSGGEHLRRERVVRYADLRPCFNAFVDTRTPGSERKENFTIVGPGVSENPDQHVHITLPHGFNVGGARQPPGCVNSQHSHLTPEVFIVHTGRWAFRSGETARDGEVLLEPGDVISLPPRMFRGFENVGPDVGFLFAVLGGDDPGRVLWAPYVFDAAERYGLVLMQDGRLIDTTVGHAPPPGSVRMPRTSAAEVAALDRYSSEDLSTRVAPAFAAPAAPGSVLSRRATGVCERPLIGPAQAQEGLPAGPLGAAHGFVLRQLDFDAGARVPTHARAEEEVLLMHRGRLRVTLGADRVELEQGDVLTVPVGVPRAFENPGDSETTLHVVRRGDSPAAPAFPS